MLTNTKSKKGLMKTVVTIFAVLSLVFIFIIFIFLFRLSAKHKTGEIETGFSSIDTELLLKNFLRIPVHDTKGNPSRDLTPDVGERITNAHLIAWTCNNNKKDQNYKALKESINTFFDDIYEDDWNLEIWYSGPDLDKKGFGHKNLIDGVKKIMARATTAGYLTFLWGSQVSSVSSATMPPYYPLFAVPYRDKGFGTQIIPCKGGSLAKVVLKSQKAYFEIKDLYAMGIKIK